MVDTVPHILIHPHHCISGCTVRLFPVVGQGGAGIGKMMLFFRGHHHQHPVRTRAAFFELLARSTGGFSDGDGRQG